jgi:hypothetical protein
MGIRQGIFAAAKANEPANPDSLDIITVARRLRHTVRQVTSEEFRWQDSHYGQDSYYGRELLFLIANNEWTRATHEIVDITRSDSVDTQIKVEVDLEQITHEAFRSRPRKLWLPLLVLSGSRRDPPAPSERPSRRWLPRRRKASTGRDGREVKPDPFASLTVTDAAGRLVALLPSTDVWHRISAALAEIIINIGVASWSGSDSERPTSTRDQRLLLSAAIYRLLQARKDDPSDASPDAMLVPGEPARDKWQGDGKMAGRIGTAKGRLDNLLAHYIQGYADPKNHDDGQTGVLLAGNYRQPSGTGNGLAQVASAFVLTRRAVEVLEGLAEAIVVVVPVSSAVTPTVFTVHAPTRQLRERLRPIVGWPRARLLIDLLLPSADADRLVQVNLPDGVSFDNSKAPSPRGGMAIEVRRPRPLDQLASLMTNLTERDGGEPQPGPVRRCVADLAMVKAEASIEALRHHLVNSTGDPDKDIRLTHGVREKLAGVHSELDALETDRDGHAGRLEEVWHAGDWLPEKLYRPTRVDTLSPRAAVARTAGIEDVSQRAAPLRARIEVNVAVADAEFFSVARFAGIMSVLLTGVVLVFFIVAAVRHHDESLDSPSPEVLAAILTLFSAILAGRLRHPDTSTLRGLLSSTGTWLIVFSVMPTVILAVALAFHVSGWPAVFWAAGAIGIQLFLELVMYRGPLSDMGSPRRLPRRRLSTWPRPAYEQSEILHTGWWRSTTAEALMIGTQAHAYVVWEHFKTPALYDLLLHAHVMRPPSGTPAFWLADPEASPEREEPVAAPQPARAYTGSPRPGPYSAAGTGDADSVNGAANWANILALLRSGTTRQALTFIIFREQPVPEWADSIQAKPVTLDPDRLAPLEVSADDIDILIGLAPDNPVPLLADHPLTKVLNVASTRQLVILDAQHPVPTPSAARIDWRWSRIRVGLRGGDIYRIADFLADIHGLAAANASWDVRVQLTPARAPRPLHPVEEREFTAGRLVLDSDMDAVTKASGTRHEHRGSRWRLMAICADARVGIEHDLIQRLATMDQHMRLAGINYATMHGMAVILLLGCQDASHPIADRGDLLAFLSSAGTNVAIPVDEWQSCLELGHAGQYPLLRIRLRSQDRPGAILDLLHLLETYLRQGFPLIRGEINTWYAQSEITSGHAAFTRFSAPLPIKDGSARDWPEFKVQELTRILEQIENDVRHATIRAAAARSPMDAFLGGAGIADEPVISINFIEAPPESD